MKIIARYFGVWGNSRTKGFMIDATASVDDLMDKIAHWFNIPQSNQLIKFNKKIGKTTIRLISGWTLRFYGLKEEEDNWIKISKIVDENKESQASHVKSFTFPLTPFKKLRTSGKLYDKLKIFAAHRPQFRAISSIKEEDEDWEDI